MMDLLGKQLMAESSILYVWQDTEYSSNFLRSHKYLQN